MATTSGLMTVEQFYALPDPRGGHYELHHGVPVIMPPPNHGHQEIQRRLMKMLEPLAAGRGVVWPEFPFRPFPEHEYWVADLVFVSQARYDSIDPDANLFGAPELVIEVLSPSNTIAEINEKEAICLENGCLEFWIVDPKRKTVKVSTPDRRAITYVESEKIPLKVPAAGELAVTEVFA